MPSTSSTPPDYWCNATGGTPPYQGSIIIGGTPTTIYSAAGFHAVDSTTGDVDPAADTPGDTPAYPTNTGWGSATCPADGSSWYYSDGNGSTHPSQGQSVDSAGSPRYGIAAANSTGSSGAYPSIHYGVALFGTAVDPGIAGRQVTAVIRWYADSAGWWDWTSLPAPAGTKEFNAAVPVQDSGTGSWSTAGAWPVSGTAADGSGLTSPCPGYAGFTIIF